MTVPINELTDQELIFIKSQAIDPEDIFDGRGMSNPTWKDLAKRGEFDFVLAGKCTNGGHRLKTRAGHCIQCRTSCIAFVRRENATANVYLAAAKNRSVIKIGYARRIYAREESLRKQGYGGYWDWEILCWVKTPHAGQIEREISDLFFDKRISGHYVKGAELQEAIEMFVYNSTQAIDIFREYVKSNLGVDPIISQ
jgi:hypothetical protein